MSHLRADLHAIAAERRAELGDRPTAEDLAAYREGRLDEPAAERVRDWLCLDPTVAGEFLERRRAR